MWFFFLFLPYFWGNLSLTQSEIARWLFWSQQMRVAYIFVDDKCKTICKMKLIKTGKSYVRCKLWTNYLGRIQFAWHFSLLAKLYTICKIICFDSFAKYVAQLEAIKQIRTLFMSSKWNSSLFFFHLPVKIWKIVHGKGIYCKKKFSPDWIKCSNKFPTANTTKNNQQELCTSIYFWEE